MSPLPPSSHDRRSGEKRRRGEEGERERGREGERERGQDKTDPFHWHGEPDVVQAYSYRVTLLYGNADEPGGYINYLITRGRGVGLGSKKAAETPPAIESHNT